MIKPERSNLQSFCRTCLDQLSTAEVSKYNLRETPNLTKLLIICTELDIQNDVDEQDAVYPQCLCTKCHRTLQDIQQFRTQAHDTAQKLKDIVNNVNIVVKEEFEPADDPLADTEESLPRISDSFSLCSEKSHDGLLATSTEIKIEATLSDDEPTNQSNAHYINAEETAQTSSDAKRKRKALESGYGPAKRSETDAVLGKTRKRTADVAKKNQPKTELEIISEFFKTPCCASSCNTCIPNEMILKARLNFQQLNKQEQDIVLLSNIEARITSSALEEIYNVSFSNKRSGQRKILSNASLIVYSFLKLPICKELFLFIHECTIDRFDILVEHFNDKGLVPMDPGLAYPSFVNSSGGSQKNSKEVFFKESCCQSKCNYLIPIEILLKARTNFEELSKHDQDLVLLGNIEAGKANSSLEDAYQQTFVRKKYGKRKVEQQKVSKIFYSFYKVPVCRQLFLFVHECGKKRFEALIKHFNEVGVVPKEYRPRGTGNKNALAETKN